MVILINECVGGQTYRTTAVNKRWACTHKIVAWVIVAPGHAPSCVRKAGSERKLRCACRQTRSIRAKSKKRPVSTRVRHLKELPHGAQ